MRRIVLFLLLGAIFMGVAMCAALMPSDEPTSCVGAGGLEDLTVKGAPIDEDQMENATFIVGVAAEEGLPKRAAVIATGTATQESGLYNLDYGYPGSTSLGLFQQIAAWGPEADRTDPVASSEMFYFGGQAGQRGLTDIPNYANLPLTVAAQAVQGSAYPDAYAVHEPEAIAIVDALWGELASAADENCETVDPLELAVRAALKMIGEPYRWPSSADVPYDGAGFVEEAFEAADVDLPGSMEDLAAYEGDEDDGVTATFIPASDFVSGAERLTRGDILLTSDDGGNRREDAERAGIYIGASTLDAVRIATYNVLGSSHTSNTGPDSGVNRIEKAYQLITSNNFTAVGLQELQPDQRRKLMSLLGDDWGIYPQLPTYGNSPEVSSVNSIIWDTTQVELQQGSNLDMPYYFGGARMQIPLVKLQHVNSGELFYVANTHDPAKPENADLRLQDANQHAEDADRLAEEGLPVFFTGDFNSGFDLRSDGNTTAGNVRGNLTWCIMTRSGNMLNGYDASRPEPRLGECPEQTTRERGIGPVDHVYVSKDVPVTDYQMIKGRDITGSDHPVVYIDAGTDGSVGAGTEFSIATYNIKTGAGFEPRVKRARELADELGWDVIGFQEAEIAPIFAELKSTFSGDKWAVYPSSIGRVYRNGLQARTIAYNTNRFELVDTDEILFERMKQDGDPQPAHAPVIRLLDKATGQEFYVANTHTSAFRRYALERKQAGDAYVEKIKELKSTGLPVFFTGDFNSSFWMDQTAALPTWQANRDNLAYCQLTKDGLMQNAKDISDGIADRDGGYCPRRKGEGEWMIDHIYVTPGVEVSEFETIERELTLSDHAARYAEVTVPAVTVPDQGSTDGQRLYVGPNPKTGVIELMPVRMDQLVGVIRLKIEPRTSSVTGDSALPIKKGQYNLTARYGEIGPYWATYHTGLDFSADLGVQVYSVADGEVVSAEYAGAYGNRIVVRNADGWEFWYCHLSAFDVTSGTVSAGTPIGKVGATGNVTGEHLHLEVRTPNGADIDPFEFLQSQGLDP